jgi:hypothetical protein
VLPVMEKMVVYFFLLIFFFVVVQLLTGGGFVTFCISHGLVFLLSLTPCFICCRSPYFLSTFLSTLVLHCTILSAVHFPLSFGFHRSPLLPLRLSSPVPSFNMLHYYTFDRMFQLILLSSFLNSCKLKVAHLFTLVSHIIVEHL